MDGARDDNGDRGWNERDKESGFVNDVMPEHQRQNTEDEFRWGSNTLVRTRGRWVDDRGRIVHRR